ncbi:MAG: hypothetical protein UE783_08780 [Prevotella sp.]|nr:hypothetical protein [Prevotella sp.]
MTQYRDEPDVHEALSGRLDSGAVLNVMLARIDAILVESQKIVDEAIEAEKVATGISDITVNKAVKAGKVYSLDGKRVSKSAKGLAIINGKKVILK